MTRSLSAKSNRHGCGTKVASKIWMRRSGVLVAPAGAEDDLAVVEGVAVCEINMNLSNQVAAFSDHAKLLP